MARELEAEGEEARVTEELGIETETETRREPDNWQPSQRDRQTDRPYKRGCWTSGWQG